MATKERILENKDKWLEALEETINGYETKDPTKKRRSYDCALCTLDDELVNDLDYCCDQCIHKSEFSQDTHCVKQKSFIHVWNGTTDNKLIRVRIRFLRGIIKKLKEA